MNDGQGGQDALEAQKAMKSVDAGVVDAAGAMDASSAVDTVEASGVVGTTEASSTIDAAPETNSNGSETSSDGGEANSEGGKSFSSAFAEKLAVAKEQDEARQALQKKKRLRVIILTAILLILAVAGAGALIWAFKTGLIASKNPGANEVKDSKVVSPEENGVSQSLRDAANRYAHFLLDGDENNKKMIREIRENDGSFSVEANLSLDADINTADEYAQTMRGLLDNYAVAMDKGYSKIKLKNKKKIKDSIASAQSSLDLAMAHLHSNYSYTDYLVEYKLGGVAAVQNKGLEQYMQLGMNIPEDDNMGEANMKKSVNSLSDDELRTSFYMKAMEKATKMGDVINLYANAKCFNEDKTIDRVCAEEVEAQNVDFFDNYYNVDKKLEQLWEELQGRFSADAQKNAKRLVEKA